MSLPPSPQAFPPEDEDIHIEQLNEADAQEIATLLSLVWPQAKHIPLAWRQQRVLSANALVDEMRQGIRYFGARLDGHIVGFYKIVETPEGLLGEHQTVHPDYRHRGLVRAMYRQFIAYAQKHQAPGNLCNILQDHHTMRALVESFGFKPKGAPYEQAPGMMVQLYFRPLHQNDS
jgi:ribosomal protein S18 acetylase RimI-like enzyme